MIWKYLPPLPDLLRHKGPLLVRLPKTVLELIALLWHPFSVCRLFNPLSSKLPDALLATSPSSGSHTNVMAVDLALGSVDDMLQFPKLVML